MRLGSQTSRGRVENKYGMEGWPLLGGVRVVGDHELFEKEAVGTLDLIHSPAREVGLTA